MRKGEYTVLICSTSPLAYSDRVAAICKAVDTDLVAVVFYTNSLPQEFLRVSLYTTNEPTIRVVDVTMREDREASSVAATAAPETTRGQALVTPLPVFGEHFELAEITASYKKSLLGNLSLSGERIAAVMALEYCARAVTLGRASAKSTLATKLRKVSV